MTDKFTPGPWKAATDADTLYLRAEDVSLATLNPDIEESQANARLIAAAPQMFEALAKAENALTMVKNSSFCETCDACGEAECWDCEVAQAQKTAVKVLKQVRADA